MHITKEKFANITYHHNLNLNPNPEQNPYSKNNPRQI